MDARLKSHYRILRILGEGGMSVVYLAEDRRSGLTVALKVVRPREGGRLPPAAVGQLRSEVRVLGSLRHPALPRVHDLLELEGLPCLAMEYIEGRNLDVVCRAEGPLAEARVLDWARQLCGALHYLHTRQPPVVFRDLKPGNVLLDGEGRIRLIDFGIAKLVEEGSGGRTQTTARGMLSRGYAAVEQYVGGTDARSDVYALGATLHFLLSGETPPDALDVATRKAPPADLRRARPEISERTCAAVEAMMQADRKARPQSVHAVMDLFGFESEEVGSAGPSLQSAACGAGPGEATRAQPARPPAPGGEPPPGASGPPTEAWDA